MQPRFQNFKSYLRERAMVQPELAYKGQGIYRRQEDFAHFINMTYEMELTPAGLDEVPILQYGMHYDGQHLFYDQKVVSTLTQQEFNEVVINHMIHFMLGCSFQFSKRPSEERLRWLKSSTALVMAHFGLARNRVYPKYSQTERDEYYDKRFKDKTKTIVFAPHEESTNYFWVKYFQGQIKLEEPFFVKESKESGKYDSPDGIIVKVATPYAYLTLGQGLALGDRNHWDERVLVLFRNEDGSLEKGNFMSKRGKELKEFKEMYELLCGGL